MVVVEFERGQFLRRAGRGGQVGFADFLVAKVAVCFVLCARALRCLGCSANDYSLLPCSRHQMKRSGAR